MRRCAAVFLALAIGSVPGCSRGVVEPKPQTHKVSGMIVFKDGKVYAEGGAIEFRHTTNAGLTSIGEIKPDGKFTLHTISAQHKVPGATEGTYAVTILPPAPDQNVRIIALQKHYHVVAGDNQLTIVADD